MTRGKLPSSERARGPQAQEPSLRPSTRSDPSDPPTLDPIGEGIAFEPWYRANADALHAQAECLLERGGYRPRAARVHAEEVVQETVARYLEAFGDGAVGAVQLERFDRLLEEVASETATEERHQARPPAQVRHEYDNCQQWNGRPFRRADEADASLPWSADEAIRPPHRETVRALRVAVGRLPDADKALLTAFYWQGKTLRQLAGERGHHHKTVQERHRRILRNLKAAITRLVRVAGGRRRQAARHIA
jgi:RNA polymerase sigma factor (sigma-70 family)